MKAWDLRVCLFSSILPSLASFQVPPLWYRQGGRTTPWRTKIRSPPPSSSFSQDKNADTATEENDPVKHERTTRQHWLDLRGTAIRPDEALAFFGEFLLEKEKKDNDSTESIKDMIDCIIVPEDTFREIPKEIASCSVDLLVVDEDSNLLHDGKGELKGTFLAGDSTFMNPLGSLDLYNRGDWILFECNDVESEELNVWVAQISSLLQLLPATAAPQSRRTESPSGLILSSITEGDDDGLTQKKGGVGICCATREAVFLVDTLLEQVMSSAGSTESANSGILLLADVNDVTIPMTSALILPFDLNLWRAVLELREETR